MRRAQALLLAALAGSCGGTDGPAPAPAVSAAPPTTATVPMPRPA